MAAGRPVIVWAQIPMAEDVRATGGGIVVESLQAVALVHAFQALLDDYGVYAQCAAALSTTFSQEHFLDQYATLYRSAGSLHG